MTEKNEKILETALTLFEEEGCAATSSSRVAKEAGVSEGLIFRHFNNKGGLLKAILLNGSEKLGAMFRELQHIRDSKEVLRRVIELPLAIEEDQKPFWKLLYALKWQADMHDEKMSAPMKEILVPALKSLGYDNAEIEAELIMVIMDGLASHILLKKPGDPNAIKQAIFSKYRL